MDTNKAFMVEMRSEEFGEELFYYESLAKAEKGFKRLVKSARRYFKKDGIARTISIITETALID